MERNLSQGQAKGNQGLKPRRRFSQGSRSKRGLGLAERGWSLAQDANALWWNLWHMGGTRGAATSTWLSEPTEDTFLEWVLFIVIQFAHEGVRCCDQGPETLRVSTGVFPEPGGERTNRSIGTGVTGERTSLWSPPARQRHFIQGCMGCWLHPGWCHPPA